MAFDETLAERVDILLQGNKGIRQKKMFGGLCFMHHGNMLCGIIENKFMARVGPEYYEAALKRAHVKPMDFTGKPLKGMVYVLPPAIKSNVQLESWIDRCFEFVGTLPSKK